MSVEQQTDPSPRRRHTWRWVSIACVAFGMLIWVKLRIVTGVPRAVYADPNEKPRPVAVEPRAPADDFVVSGSESASMPNERPGEAPSAPKTGSPRAEGLPPR